MSQGDTPGCSPRRQSLLPHLLIETRFIEIHGHLTLIVIKGPSIDLKRVWCCQIKAGSTNADIGGRGKYIGRAPLHHENSLADFRRTGVFFPDGLSAYCAPEGLKGSSRCRAEA